MRDVEGSMVSLNFPFLRHASSAASVRQGQVTPVQCCWNGIVALNAAPFIAGLRFRSHLPNDCYTSECSLLCNDMHRLGFCNIIIDPSVRVAHTIELFTALHDENQDPQYHIYNQSAQISCKSHLDAFPRSDKVQCCPLHQGHDYINWSDPRCFPYNFMQIPGVDVTSGLSTGPSSNGSVLQAAKLAAGSRHA
jgi:hypothetical protein